MSHTVKYTIAIPAFKAAFLDECISSILNQTYPNLELIIVNDHSPEDIDSIVRNHSDPRIKYFKNDVGFGEFNVSRNWDECLKHASGEYFICLGDDDKLLPDCLDKYNKLTRDNPDCKVFHIRTQIIDENSSVFSLQEGRPSAESALSMVWHRWCAGGRKSWIGDYLFDTKELKEIGGFIWFPYAWGSEEATVYFLASRNGIANSNEFGFQYRVNRLSITHSTLNLKGKADSFIPYREWFQSFLETCPDFDETDPLYRQILKARFKSYFSDSICMIIRDDSSVNHLKNAISWIRDRKKYQLSLKQVLKSEFVGFRKAL